MKKIWIAIYCFLGVSPLLAFSYIGSEGIPSDQPLKTIIISLHFKNSPVPSRDSLQDVRRRVFDDYSNFLKEFSYDKFYFFGDAIGPLEIPIEATCDEPQIVQEGDQAAAQLGLDLSSYGWVIYYALNSNCTSHYVHVGGKQVLQTNWGGSSSAESGYRKSWMHDEIGHAANIYHAGAFDCNDVSIKTDLTQCVANDAGNPYDDMGYLSDGHFNAKYKEHLGWLNVPVATTNGVYDLTPLEWPGAKALKIVVPEGVYYLEYRQRIGIDSVEQSHNLNSSFRMDGVLINFVTTKSRWGLAEANLLDMTPETSDNYQGYPTDAALRPGRSFTDPFTGFTITTISTSPTSCRINIQNLTYRDTVPPTVSIQNVSEGAVLSRGQVVALTPASSDNNIQDPYTNEIYKDDILIRPPTFNWDTTNELLGPHTISVISRDFANNTTNMTVHVNLAADTTPPTAFFSSPKNNTSVSGIVPVIVGSSDTVRVTKVEFYVDNILSGVSTQGVYTSFPTPPFYTHTFSWDTTKVTPGVHLLKVLATDQDNNVRNTTITVTVVSDTVPPSVNLSMTPETGVVNGSEISGRITLTANASDNLAVSKTEIYFDGVLMSSSASGLTKIPVWDTYRYPNGPHTLTAKAYDNSNNFSVKPLSMTINNLPDVSPPVLTIVNPTDRAVFIEKPPVGVSVLFAARAVDSSEVKAVDFILNGAFVESVSELSSFTSPPSYATTCFSARDCGQAKMWDGWNRLDVKARDLFNNVATQSVFFMIDGNNDVFVDTLTVTSMPQQLNGVVLGSATLNYTSTMAPDVAGVQFKLDGANLGLEDRDYPFTMVWFSTQTTDGAHQVTASVRTKTGEVVSSPVNVTVDNRGPSVSITSPQNGASLSGNVLVRVLAFDIVGIGKVELYDGSLKLGSANTADSTFPWDTTHAVNGSHTLTAKAYDTPKFLNTNNNDTFSNMATFSITVNVFNADSIPPSSPVWQNLQGSTVSGSAFLRVNASDNIGINKVELYRNNVLVGLLQPNMGAFDFIWDTTKVSDGFHTLTAKAYDFAGNASVPKNLSIYVRNTVSPTISITNPLDGEILTDPLTIDVSASDDVGLKKVEVYKNNSLLCSLSNWPNGYLPKGPTSCNWDINEDLNGLYTLEAKAYDAVDNVALSSIEVRLASQDAPSILIGSPSDGSTLSGIASITGSAWDSDGIFKVELYEDETLMGIHYNSSFPFTWDTTLTSNGSHSLTAIAYDSSYHTGFHRINVTVSNSGGGGSSLHPADIDRNSIMTLNEVISFGACWKSNCKPEATFEYVVRAGYLWSASAEGRYQYNSGAACPLCWEP